MHSEQVSVDACDSASFRGVKVRPAMHIWLDFQVVNITTGEYAALHFTQCGFFGYASYQMSATDVFMHLLHVVNAWDAQHMVVSLRIFISEPAMLMLDCALMI